MPPAKPVTLRKTIAKTKFRKRFGFFLGGGCGGGDGGVSLLSGVVGVGFVGCMWLTSRWGLEGMEVGGAV